MLAIETALEPLECFALHLHIKHYLKILTFLDYSPEHGVQGDKWKFLTGLNGSPPFDLIFVILTVVWTSWGWTALSFPDLKFMKLISNSF